MLNADDNRYHFDGKSSSIVTVLTGQTAIVETIAARYRIQEERNYSPATSQTSMGMTIAVNEMAFLVAS